MKDDVFVSLVEYLTKVPAIDKSIGFGGEGEFWWVKFQIDINHSLAWQVVQELGHVCNYLSMDERLPTVFFPVSAPPYLNGGPKNFLMWVIECRSPTFKPEDLQVWLQGRLPRPVDDLTLWEID